LELAAVREAEQRSAAGLIGYQDVAFLHRPEGALVNDLALREQLVRIIRTFRPDVVAAPDPTVIFPAIGGVQHVDHREAGQAAVDAVAPAARNAMAFVNLFTSEGLEPHAVDRLYLYSSDLPDLEIDISEVIETKLAAVREHRSQLRDRARIAEIGSRETFRVIDLA
jgi:LmbE family N-acetylglucosaminyl deacetylase